MKKSKKSKKSNTWRIKQHRDLFFKKSKTLGYRSRAAFKLIELNEKFKFLKDDTKLLDIGGYPGGWAQVASKIIASGKILSVDLQKIIKIKNVTFLEGDFLKENTQDRIFEFFQRLNLKSKTLMVVVNKFFAFSSVLKQKRFFQFSQWPTE